MKIKVTMIFKRLGMFLDYSIMKFVDGNPVHEAPANVVREENID